MKRKNLTALAVRVGEEPVVLTLANELEPVQQLVGGWIEVVQITEDILLIVDEEGMLKEKPHNFFIMVVRNGEIIPTHTIHGDALFVSRLGEDFYSLDKTQVALVKEMFSINRDVLEVIQDV